MSEFSKKVLIALLLFANASYMIAGGGIKRSEWDFRPEITTGNIVYFLPINTLSLLFGTKLSSGNWNGEPTSENYPWWYPQIGWRMTTISEVQYADVSLHNSDIKESMLDWVDPEYSIGYNINYTSKRIPLGFRVKLAYAHENFKARNRKIKGDWTTFSKDLIVPEVAIKVLFGKYRTSEQMFVLSLGASYDYAFKAKGLYKGKETVNNGISGIVGLEFASPARHFEFGGNARIPFYDYFNKDYSPDGGITYPYSSAETRLWKGIELYLRFGF